MEIVDIQATILTLNRFADYLKSIREAALRLSPERHNDPEVLFQIASIRAHLERTFEAGIAIGEELMAAIPSLMDFPVELTDVLDAQTRLGNETHQTMNVLELIDPTLANPAATYH